MASRLQGPAVDLSLDLFKSGQSTGPAFKSSLDASIPKAESTFLASDSSSLNQVGTPLTSVQVEGSAAKTLPESSFVTRKCVNRASSIMQEGQDLRPPTRKVRPSPAIGMLLARHASSATPEAVIVEGNRNVCISLPSSPSVLASVLMDVRRCLCARDYACGIGILLE